MSYGKTITLFLVEGNAEGTVIAELSNWNGKAIKVSRSSIKDYKREDLNVSGIYFLFSETQEGNKAVYIGEAGNLKNRLLQHIDDYNKNKEEFYWNIVVVFSGKVLDRTRIRYLENKLVDIAKKIAVYKVLTKNTYKNEMISESVRAEMDEFIDNIKIIINTLGFNFLEEVGAFTKEISNSNNSNTKNLIKLYCKDKKDKNISAEGFIDVNGFIVLKDSHISHNIKDSFEEGQPGYFKLRKKLEKNGIINNYTFTKDTLFFSPSAAAAVILGRNANGKKEWKNNEGIALKDLNL